MKPICCTYLHMHMFLMQDFPIHNLGVCYPSETILTGAKRREWMGMGVAGIIIDSYCGSFPHSLHLAPVSIKVSEVQKYYHTRPQRCPKMVDNSLLVKPSFFWAIGMYRYLLGGIPTYLARKMMEWKSVGIMTFPICIYTHIYMENKSCSKPATRYVRFVRLNHVESPWHRLNFA